MKRKKKDSKAHDEQNGWGEWGGYMGAKRAKLLEQFQGGGIEKVSDIFAGVVIHVNGLTRPPSDELKKIMAAHGGIYHEYQTSSTTHVIASNLAGVKIKHLGNVPIVKARWITDSVDIGKLLDYKRYLLYNNQRRSQPSLPFPVIEKAEPAAPEVKENKEKPAGLTVSECKENMVKPPSEASHESLEVNTSSRSNAQSCFATKTASDPAFLQEFYNNSRLHLISTLGAEYKQLVNHMRDNSTGKFPGTEKLISALGDGRSNHIVPSSVVMHIDMDCFFVSVGLKKHPELRGKPVAITHARNGQLTNISEERKAAREQEIALYGERLPVGVTSRVDRIDAQSSMSEIASCSYEARACGIKNGMFLGQAIKMCPELKTLPYDFEGYKEASNLLYNILASYTLDIEAVSCDEMYVDVTNILRETRLGVEQWASHIRSEITEATGCPCSTGFGANRLQARLATRKAKPAGQYYLQADDVESYMCEIPLADLPGVGRATLAKLRNLGLNTCGDIQVASLKVLQTEIGHKAGETLMDQARGIDNKPLCFTHQRKSVSAEVNYGIRFKTSEECCNFLKSLSEEVYNRLSAINMRARCLTLKLLVRAAEAPVETAKFLGHGICDSFSKSTTSNILFNNSQVIYKEVQVLYEKMNQTFADLRGIGIQLSKLEKNIPMSNALSNFLRQGPSDQDMTNVESVASLSKNESRKNVTLVDKGTNTESETVVEEETPKPSVTNQSFEKSKRGRPKGTKNGLKNKTLKTKNVTKSVSEFFGSKRGPESTSKGKNSKPNVQVSLEVLRELPEEIRREIIRDYQLEDVNAKPIKNNILNTGNVVEKHENLPSETKNESPFSKLTVDQIKPIIMQWIASTDTPDDYDIEMIATHFKQLAIDRKIEELLRAFNFLHRSFSKLNCHWHNAYYSIVNIMQQGMVARYGRTLLVNRAFDCCHI